jgi:putative transposase
VCARESRRGSATRLSYPLRLPDELQAPAVALLTFALPHEQQVVDALWSRLDEIDQIEGKHIWKPLEGWLPRPEDVPSRPWRCILERGGRVLRAQADRKRVFDLLLPLLADEHLANGSANPSAGGSTGTPRGSEHRLTALAYQLRDEMGSPSTSSGRSNQEKIGYLVNLVEQTANFYAENGKLPADYYELQGKPVLKRPQLPLAADDGAVKGQAYKMSVVDGQITLRFKYPDGDDKWRWTPDVTFPVPDVVDPAVPLAPTLRLKEIKGGETVAVLDFVVEDSSPRQQPGGDNVLAFDWGVRRLLSFTILSRGGEQLPPPFFVDIGGLAGKQARLRQQIDVLKAKKARLKKEGRARVQAEIDACWRKYNATNEALAHFASNLLIIFALLFDCNLIAGEWLKTLKARRKKRGRNHRKLRTLNWKVNTTIREAIWNKLEYKVKRFSIGTRRVWPRGSSHECPRCGGQGVTCKSPEHRNEVSRYGHWFFCLDPACGYNADRDYVASLNIGRRALTEDYPSDEKDESECQPVSYTGAGTALPFPSPDALLQSVRCASIGGRVCPTAQHSPRLLKRLGTTLTGFDKAIAVGPMWLPGYG